MSYKDEESGEDEDGGQHISNGDLGSSWSFRRMKVFRTQVWRRFGKRERGVTSCPSLISPQSAKDRIGNESAPRFANSSDPNP
jgi:hypothetical protein